MSGQSGGARPAVRGRRCRTRGGRLAGSGRAGGRGSPYGSSRALACGLYLDAGRGTLSAALTLDLRRQFGYRRCTAL